MNSAIAMTMSLSLVTASAFGSCRVSKDGTFISESSQRDVTTLQLDNDDTIQICRGAFSIAVQYRRPATDLELLQAFSENQRLDLALDGVVTDEQELDLRGGYNGLDTVIEGYRVQCTK